MSLVHPPRKKVSGKLHLPQNSMNLHYIDENTLITTEVWNNVRDAWSMNNVITTGDGYMWVKKWEKGKNYHIRKTFNREGMLVCIYVDICSPILAENKVFSFTDWYLDVWMEKGKEPIFLDEDELESAQKMNYISSDEVEIIKKTGNYVIEGLKDRSLIDF